MLSANYLYTKAPHKIHPSHYDRNHASPNVGQSLRSSKLMAPTEQTVVNKSILETACSSLQRQ